jgi:hypothetical protein
MYAYINPPAAVTLHPAGTLEWLGDMASQLTLDVIQRFRAAMNAAAVTAIQVLSVWHLLARGWETRAATPQSALMVLQPGMLRLVQRLALQPPPAPAAAVDLDHLTQAAVLACMSVITNCSGVVVDVGLHPAVKPGYERVRSSSGNGSMVDSPTTEQTALVLAAEVRPRLGTARCKLTPALVNLSMCM